MNTDILLIIGLVLFTIIGAVARLSKPSRKVYALFISFGLSIVMINVLNTHLLDYSWYQTVTTWLNNNGFIKAFINVVIVIVSTLVTSILIGLLLKVIALALKDAGIILPSLSAAAIAAISGFMCIIAVLQICSHLNVEVDAPTFNNLIVKILNA